MEMKKTILVTSGSGVIRFVIIQYFYKKNYNVIIVGLSNKKKTNQILNRI
jgi:NAD(P)-dependent dehydrogenase (short-subunit alcohol dehydrogenase family)